ncbi:zinc finger CW-type PWWP domain protein 1-like, partial [Danaus plexippus]|uniref:zinc finger CW-type PWWP domain protein 1-like n=1 Tax=Danaus plexippus TaxID=13037 RepID=UPI002AB2D16E
HELHLSQPSRGLTHLQKLIWLQSKRTKGLWVQCDECDRWRYLPDILDRYELPKKWFCWMNSDKSLASCAAPESPIHLHDEEDLIHNEYSAGSLVLARIPGWPWWPAMVDDCPDTEQFYWLDGFSDIPTHYNVVFFDQYEVTRAWIDPLHLKPYCKQKNTVKLSSNNKKYRNRLEAAILQANDAETLSLMGRLKKYSFICRYKGPILKPKTVTKKYKEKYQKQFKRKYNIDLLDDSSESESDSDSISNVIPSKKKYSTLSKNTKVIKEDDAKKKCDGSVQKHSSILIQETKKSDSTHVTVTHESSKTNIVKETEKKINTPSTQIGENRERSPASEDFDF